MTNGIAKEALKGYVDRIERLEEEIADLNGDKAEVYKEAKGTGFDVKILRKVVQRRRKGDSEREEEDSLLELYEDALQGG